MYRKDRRVRCFSASWINAEACSASLNDLLTPLAPVPILIPYATVQEPTGAVSIAE
jgi:hypothetical protein